jgi:streptogramin lyase
MWFTEESKDKIGEVTAAGKVKTYDVPTANAWPTSITAGPDGNLWFVEQGMPGRGATFPDKIGQITLKGVITEFPIHADGGGTPVAITAGSDGNLWFVEEYGELSYIDEMATDGILLAGYEISGGPAADITAGPDGNLWFTENDAIGRITTSGSVTYISTPSSVLPLDIAPGGDGALWFTSYNGYVGRVTTTGIVSVYTVPAPTGGASTPNPWGISPGPDGNVWVALYGTDQIARVNTQPGLTGQMTVYDVPISGELAGPYAIAAGVNGDIWFTDYLAGEIVDYPISPVISQYPAPASANAIFGTTPGINADEWFTDYADNQVDRVCSNGTLQTYGVPTAGGGPYGVTEGPYPHRINQQVVGIWFTEFGADRIGVIPEGGAVDAFDACATLSATDFPIPTANSGPQAITSGPDGALWFTEVDADQIGRITDTGTVTEYPVPTAGSEPEDIVTGPDGNLWFTELAADQIGRITPSGVVTEFAIPTAGSEPDGITAGSDGNLWFTEAHGNQIGRITTSGVITEFPVPTAESEPDKIAAGPDGNLWFTEYTGAQVGRITTSGTVTEFTLGEDQFPNAIAATYGGLVFSDRLGPGWGIGTLLPPGSNAVVLPSGPVSASTTVPIGSSLIWTQLAPAAQTIADATGMHLYSTATAGLGTGGILSYRFRAAGTYPYIAAATGSTTANGTVGVPIQVAPNQTDTNDPVTVTWALAPAPYGYVYDVQVKVPGGSFKSWIRGTTAASSTFSADSAAGYYIFRARLRNSSSGAHSGWSPEAEFEAV